MLEDTKPRMPPASRTASTAVIGEAPDKCPVCALKGENYEIIS